MANNIPDPDRVYPLPLYNRLCFLKNIVKNQRLSELNKPINQLKIAPNAKPPAWAQ